MQAPNRFEGQYASWWDLGVGTPKSGDQLGTCSQAVFVAQGVGGGNPRRRGMRYLLDPAGSHFSLLLVMHRDTRVKDFEMSLLVHIITIHILNSGIGKYSL